MQIKKKYINICVCEEVRLFLHVYLRIKFFDFHCIYFNGLQNSWLILQREFTAVYIPII
jgi:hypothetical protein